MVSVRRPIARFLSDYGMLLVLLVLCACFSVATLDEQHPHGAAGGEQLAREVIEQAGPSARVLVAVRDTQEDAEFAAACSARLTTAGAVVLATVRGHPGDARLALQQLADTGKRLDVIATNQATAAWKVFRDLDRRWPSLGPVKILTPHSYVWPNFLKAENLWNIAGQIAVIAILAVGMTLVIITGGIDLSVGSLIALSAVLATLLIRDLAGAEHASSTALCLCCLAAIGACGLVGLFSGTMITAFGVPSFLVTLVVMLMARGLAGMLSNDQSIFQVPDSFVWLGRGADLFGIPNAVVLMVLLYVVAHGGMTRLTVGRYIYAVGGNTEAARLSGVPVWQVLVLVYVISGALAGLGGVVMASQLRSGSPVYGVEYELYAIAAVVVGGTSIKGGEGKVFGTLIGAFLIAAIQNFMNLAGIGYWPQKVILGAVLLAAVLLDRLKRRSWDVRRLMGRLRPQFSLRSKVIHR